MPDSDRYCNYKITVFHILLFHLFLATYCLFIWHLFNTCDCDSCNSSLGSLEDVLRSTNILQSSKPLLHRLLFFTFCHLIFSYYDLDFSFLLLSFFLVRRIYRWCILISYVFLSFDFLSSIFVSSFLLLLSLFISFSFCCSS